MGGGCPCSTIMAVSHLHGSQMNAPNAHARRRAPSSPLLLRWGPLQLSAAPPGPGVRPLTPQAAARTPQYFVIPPHEKQQLIFNHVLARLEMVFYNSGSAGCIMDGVSWLMHWGWLSEGKRESHGMERERGGFWERGPGPQFLCEGLKRGGCTVK